MFHARSVFRIIGCGVLFLTSLHAKPVTPDIVAEASPVSVQTAPTPAHESEIPLLAAKFDTTPEPLPPSVPSLGFEATGTSEFGDLIRFAGIGHFIDSVSVTLFSGAIQSEFPRSDPAGLNHPITLKIYAVERGTGPVKPGAVLASLTENVLIHWRPAPDT